MQEYDEVWSNETHKGLGAGLVAGISSAAASKPSQSFQLYTNNVQTLSTNTVNQGSDIEGLLYVPTLDSLDPCANASSQYVPSDVTRVQNLPPTQYLYVAFAPWFSAACTKSYLAAARSAVAFLFYVPSQTTSVEPPSPDDETWNLGDGGRWKRQNKFPVYVVPGADGAQIMQQLAIYSGDLSQAQNGDILRQEFRPTDYVRLYASFSTGSDSHLPTLWAFLLIVLAVVLLLVGATSFSMHYVQRRHRRDLQRRLQNGEVDLETLGIKRQCLTQAQIDTLPLIPYVPNEKKPPLPLPAPDSSTSPEISGPIPVAAASPQDYNQPTCPICLEDYVPNETSVRSLPCHHIYHPGCIEPFLLGNSSLCPVCKTKVDLPGLRPGSRATNYPPITNAMVRRERYARRLRERGEQANTSVNGLGRWTSFRRQFRQPVSHTAPRRRGFVAPPSRHSPAPSAEPEFFMMELGAWPRTAPQTIPNPAPPSTRNAPRGTPTTETTPSTDARLAPTETTPRPRPPQDPERRREWARRRASALLGRGHGIIGDEVVDADEEERGRRAEMPKWRKALGSVFPGFR
ncbi:MAG: hypothetical protein Q9217_004596 [Psora testacea]